jgi:hypothetical protein
MLHNLAKAVRELQRTFGDAFSPYRPEHYYMRGPGPACRAKPTRRAPSAALVRRDTPPALVRFAKSRG